MEATCRITLGKQIAASANKCAVTGREKKDGRGGRYWLQEHAASMNCHESGEEARQLSYCNESQIGLQAPVAPDRCRGTSGLFSILKYQVQYYTTRFHYACSFTALKKKIVCPPS